MNQHGEFLTQFHSFLEHDLGPSPAPSDAQIAMIMGFVQEYLKYLPKIERVATRQIA